MFLIGQKIVCVDDGGLNDGSPCVNPVRGEVYTVRGFDTCDCGFPAGIWLSEISNRRVPLYCRDCGLTVRGEPPFLVRRFRPVRETDIDIFTKMLAPTPRRAKQKA